MRKAAIIMFLLGFMYANRTLSQNTGFAGKRVLLKTDLVNGLYGFCNGYSAEVALNRKMTFEIGYDLINTSVRQSYDPIETVGTNITINSKAQTAYNGFSIKFKKYFSREKPAPYGLFIHATFANGNLEIEKGTYPEQLFIKDGSQDISYSVKGINLNRYGMGMGYQKPINKWLFIGGHFTFNYITFGNLIEGLPQNVASGVLKNYGSNLFSTNIFNEEKPPQDQQTRSFGISGNIQLGIMLF